MRVFVTGVAGFVGRHLLDSWGPGAEFHGADHLPLDAMPGGEALKPRLASYRALDITEAGATAAAVREIQPDAVVHLAAQSSGAASLLDPVGTYRVNALGSLHLLEAVRTGAPGATLLLVGSADAYGSGGAGSLIREDAPLRPANPYGLSKAAQDALGELYAATYRARVVRTRTFSHTGPGQRPQFALAAFAEQIARVDAGLQPPEIRVGNLDAVREYGDVRDVVAAYRALVERGEPGEAYNVCTGEGHRLRDLLDRLLALAGVRATVVSDPSRVRSRDVDHVVGDPAKIRARTGWTPRVPLERTLTDLYQDARARVRRESGR
ncbi:MAG TPA: GDP-mannose 4,6-dehydratase [Candidatus Eisenbacteria bacterium]|nr:GDP-mannose 4,6-dehydratase [Candidatus Eisenbacteria bacterium]